MKFRRSRGFVARLIVLGIGCLILFAWYNLYFRKVEDTPEMTKMRLIKARAVHVGAQILGTVDISQPTGGRGNPPRQSKYRFNVGGREYSGWFVAEKGATSVEITYCSDNPSLHCVGNVDDYFAKSSDVSLGFVVATTLAFGLGLPLVWAGLKG